VRIVPATDYWSGGGNNNLASNPDNYVGGQLPNNGDVLIVDGVFHGPPAGNANKDVNFDAAFNVQLAQVQVLNGYQGSVTFQANTTVTDRVTLETGITSVNAGATLSAPNFSVNGGSLGGGGTLSVGLPNQPGQLAFNVASIHGIANVIVNAGSSLVFNADTGLSSQVTNNGLVGWGQADVTLGAGAQLVNNGTVQALSNQTLSGAGSFLNNGTFIKDGSAGTTAIDVTYTQTANGSIQANTGTLNFSKHVELSSPVIVAAGAEVDFLDDTQNFNPGTIFNGAGTVGVIDAANAQIVGGFNLVTNSGFVLNVTDPTTGLGGVGVLTTNGSFEWGAGTINGLQEIDLYGTTTLSGGDAHTLVQTTLNQYGTANWLDEGTISLDHSLWENYGSFQILNNNASMNLLNPDTDAFSAFENRVTQTSRGLVSKSVPPDALGRGTTFELPFRTWGDLRLSGSALVTFNQGVQQNGASSETDLEGAWLGLGAGQGLILNAGTVEGYGTIGGWLWNVGGCVWVGNASGTTLNVTGSYVQQYSASLLVYAAGNNAWGKLSVTGNAEFSSGSTVFVDLNNGYVPVAGFVKRVVTTGGTVSGVPTGQGGFTVQPGANFIDLQA
jgi:hypothetical protein